MLQPIRSTPQIWVVTRHQCRISDVISRGNQGWRHDISAVFTGYNFTFTRDLSYCAFGLFTAVKCYAHVPYSQVTLETHPVVLEERCLNSRINITTFFNFPDMFRRQPPPQALRFLHDRGERETSDWWYFPPSFARTFSSKERRLGTRQFRRYIRHLQCYIFWNRRWI